VGKEFDGHAYGLIKGTHSALSQKDSKIMERPHS
jgi:hypothetical protein